jgi:putative endonuclease
MPHGKPRSYFVYILSSNRGVLYVGVTNDLQRRLAEHRQGEGRGFTPRYKVHRLIYFEETPDIRSALQREKQIKAWGREKKLALIREANARFEDLAADLTPVGWTTSRPPVRFVIRLGDSHLHLRLRRSCRRKCRAARRPSE